MGVFVSFYYHRQPRAEAAQKFVGDRAAARGDFPGAQRRSIADKLGDVPVGAARHVRYVHGELIHAYPSCDRRETSVDTDEPGIGERTGIAVGVADGQHGDAALSTRSERAVIPDALALRHISNGGDARPERENGTQTERARCGSLRRAIER